MAQVINFSGIDDEKESLDVEIRLPSLRTALNRQQTKIITLSKAFVRLLRSTREEAIKRYFVHGPAQDGIECTLLLAHDRDGRKSGIAQIKKAA